MRTTILVLIAVFSGCAYLIGTAIGADWLRLIAKPWPVLMMAAWVWPSGERRIAIGLVFGAIGDICLAVPSAFMPGMVAFAIGHGLYVAAFISWQRRLSALLAVPVAIYLITTVALMLPNTGPLTIPVIFYMGIIGLMLWRAAAVANNDSDPGFMRWSPLLGALLFGFSDSLIGINKFVTPLPGAAYPIILLYWAGQGLIAAAAVVRVKMLQQPAPARRPTSTN